MTSLFGLTGAVLAVPAAALFKILIDEFYLRHHLLNEDQIQSQAKDIILGESCNGQRVGDRVTGDPTNHEA